MTSFYRRLLVCLICLDYAWGQLDGNRQGILTSEYGRISNIANENIFVSTSLSRMDCTRQCTDFARNHREYFARDCFAYNYDASSYTCELIHSIDPLVYEISVLSGWIAGFKYQSIDNPHPTMFN